MVKILRYLNFEHVVIKIQINYRNKKPYFQYQFRKKIYQNFLITVLEME
jgi:hypothetical protein